VRFPMAVPGFFTKSEIKLPRLNLGDDENQAGGHRLPLASAVMVIATEKVQIRGR
jgi:hypothetical protein